MTTTEKNKPVPKLKCRVYVAAKWEDREAAASFAEKLGKYPGVTITSSWLERETLRPMTEEAAQDFKDIDNSNAFVVFPRRLSRGPDTSGGRHVETGYAYAKGLTIIYYQRNPEHIFHGLPGMFVRDNVHSVALLLLGHFKLEYPVVETRDCRLRGSRR